MTKGKKKKPMTAADLMKSLNADPEFVARRERKEAERQAREAEWIRAEAPLVEELNAAGFAVDSAWDLVNTSEPYPDACPILVRHLKRPYPDRVLEGIIRALTVPWAAEAAPVLITEFERRANDSAGTGLRWVIGNALSVLADDAFYDDIVRLAQDRRYGLDRERLAIALGNMRKTPQAVDVLVELLDDEEVAGSALVGLRKLAGRKKTRGRVAAARGRIESFLDHPKTWVRNEAKKILAKLDKHAPGADGGKTR